MKKLFPFLALVCLLLSVLPVAAQSEVQLVPGTVAIEPEQAQLVLAWLAENPPAETPLYAPTYLQFTQGYTYISLVALRADLPAPYVWTLTDSDDVLWMGTLTIHPDGSISPFGLAVIPSTARRASLAANLKAGAGGGASISLPWQAGKQMMFGPRGVHGSGDYGTSGMFAVDWVGGDNLTNSAPAAVFASASGAVDWVCHDGTSSAVRVTDGSGNTFVYAHLLQNANLVNAHSFSKGSLIGALKYGSFSDNCGWGEQASNHYHVHWMFTPRNGYFQAEGWVLKLSTSVWTGPGNKTAKTNQFIVGGVGGAYTNPGTSNPADDGLIGTGTQAGTGVYVWDFVIGGLGTVTQTVMDSLLYKRGSACASGGDPLNLGPDPAATATPGAETTPTFHSSGGLATVGRPCYAEAYWDNFIEKSKSVIHEGGLVTYIFAVAFPSMSILTLLFVVIFIALFEFVVWAMKLQKIIGEFWNMFPGL